MIYKENFLSKNKARVLIVLVVLTITVLLIAILGSNRLINQQTDTKLAESVTQQIIPENDNLDNPNQENLGYMYDPDEWEEADYFGGGHGTSGSPYQLYTVQHLNNIRYISGKRYYKLAGNINFAGGSFAPLNAEDSVFDGNGYKISNVNISSSGSNVGFLSGINNGVVKNLTFENINVSGTGAGDKYIGALAGKITGKDVSVTNVKITGTSKIEGGGSFSNEYIGGIAGYVDANGIKNCNVNAQILTTGSATNLHSGGIVGYVNFTEISGNTANVNIKNTAQTTTAYVGGLAGKIIGNSSLIGTDKNYFAIIKNNNVVGTSKIEKSAMSSNEFDGGLAGHIEYAKIQNNNSAGEIINNANGTNNHIGGGIGFAKDSEVFDNSSNITINNNAQSENIYIGGYFGEIINSYVIERVAAKGIINVGGNKVIAGGFVGSTNNSKIINAYAAVEMTGSGKEGACIGGFVGDNNSIIENIYSIGKIRVTTGNKGAIVGTDLGKYYLKNAYWSPELAEVTPENSIDAGNARTAQELLHSRNFENWDFTSIWRGGDGSTFPHFSVESGVAESSVNYLKYQGIGTEANPYLINTKEQLQNLKNTTSTNNYKLISDIDLSNVANFEPTGTYIAPFQLKLNGDGYKISNITIVSDKQYVGLFGYINNGTVKNLEIENISVKCENVTDSVLHIGGLAGIITAPTGTENSKSLIENVKIIGNNKIEDPATCQIEYVGGLAGTIEKTNIIKSHVEANILTDTRGYNLYVGGISGVASQSTLSESNTNINIKNSAQCTNNFIGGLIGEAKNETAIEKVFSKGLIEIGNKIVKVGGLIGNANTNTSINNVYANVKITGEGNRESVIGGIIGETEVPVDKAYAVGQISVTSGDKGGLAGTDEANTYFTYSYWSPEKSGISEEESIPAGNVRTEQQMMDQANYENWDFNNIWVINPNNQEYPFPQFIYETGTDEPTNTVTITKYEKDTTIPISGVQIGIYDETGNTLIKGKNNQDLIGTTDNRGKINFSELADFNPGTYMYKEVTPKNGYYLNATGYKFTVTSDGSIIYENNTRGILYNKKIKAEVGQAVVTKYIYGTTIPLEGAEITLCTSDGGMYLLDNREVKLTTNSEGKCDFGAEVVLVPGKYYFKESKAPQLYQTDSTPHYFIVNNDGTVTFDETNGILYNKKVLAKEGYVVITKYKKGTRTPVPGAEIALCDVEGNIRTYEGRELKGLTDSEGHLDFTTIVSLEAGGPYYFRETKAPAGYVLDATPHEFSINNEGEAVFVDLYGLIYNSPVIVERGKAVIVKYRAGTTIPLYGAEIALCDENGEILFKNGIELKGVTDKNGQLDLATITDLEPGKHYFRETNPPTGYSVDEHIYYLIVDNEGNVSFDPANGTIYDEIKVTPTGVTPTGVTPTGVTPTGVTPTGVTPTGVTPTGVTPTGVTPTGVTPTGVTPTGVTPTGVTPTGVTPTGVTPTGVTPTGVTPTGVTPTGVTPTGVTPTGVTPTGVTPTGVTPTGVTPTGVTPTGVTPTGVTPTGVTPTGVTPTGVTPTGVTPTGVTPTGVTPTGVTPTGVTPTGVTPTGVTPTGVTPTGVTPTGVTPTGVTPTGVTPTGVTPTGVTPTGMSGGNNSTSNTGTITIIPGAKIGIYDETGKAIVDTNGKTLEILTDKNGKINEETIKKLAPGTYEYKVISVPDGYNVDKTKTHKFTVDRQGNIVYLDGENGVVTGTNTNAKSGILPYTGAKVTLTTITIITIAIVSALAIRYRKIG